MFLCICQKEWLIVGLTRFLQRHLSSVRGKMSLCLSNILRKMKVIRLFRLMKKGILALLSFALITLLLVPQAARAAELDQTTKLNTMISDTVHYYQQNGKNLASWWQMVALWGAGENLHNGKWTLPAWEKVDPKFLANVGGTDHIQKIFGLLAMDRNPAVAWETKRNLYAELAAQQNATTGAIGGINKHIWAMIALDTGEKLKHNVGTWNQAAKDNALSYLLRMQLTDGGYALSGSISDTDITGMALLALGNYQSNSAVVTAIGRAKALLKQRQLNNGGFDSTGPWGSGDNSNSWATSVSGLVAAGEDVLSANWIVENHSVVDAVYNFQLPSGVFAWKVTDPRPNLMATEQVLIALTDIQQGKSVWQRFADKANVTTVQLNVNGINQPILPQQSVAAAVYGRQPTAMDALKQALDKSDIHYVIQDSSYGAYLSSVAGQDAETLGGYDGWMYKVNGVSPQVGAADYILNDDDVVTFYYGRWPSIAIASNTNIGILNPSLQIKLVGDTFTSGANTAANWSFDPGNTGLTIEHITQESNQQDLVITFAGQGQTGALKLQALPAALVSNSASNTVTIHNVSTSGDQIVNVGANESNVSFSTDANDPATNIVTLSFTTPALPEVIAKRGNTELNIPAYTEVTSVAWNNEIQLPRILSTTDNSVTNKVNGVLTNSGSKLDSIDSHIKVGGDSRIQFNQHVTLKLKGMGDRNAGFIDENGNFTAIPKYDNSNYRNDDVYAYSENGDLIIKTKHFTEFLAFKSTLVTAPGPGGGSGPSITQKVTLSVEKRSLGEGDIIAPITVTLQSGDTAFTLLKRELDAQRIPLAFKGADASIYVQSIDNLKEMDRDLPQSGWMYSVNGVFPKKSAGIYFLQNNDILRWQFTKNLGEDIGDVYTPVIVPPVVVPPVPANSEKPEEPTEETQSTLAAEYEDAAAISNWAQNAVAKATALGYMDGTGTKFEPKRELTRAEFAALIIRFTGAELVSGESDFDDVSTDDWFYKYVATAKAKGLISGVADHSFAPNQTISRQEMAVILGRLQGVSIKEQQDKGLKDQANISAWALPYVNLAIDAGLLTDDGGFFNPLLPVTREMVAVVIMRLHEMKK